MFEQRTEKRTERATDKKRGYSAPSLVQSRSQVNCVLCLNGAVQRKEAKVTSVNLRPCLRTIELARKIESSHCGRLSFREEEPVYTEIFFYSSKSDLFYFIIIIFFKITFVSFSVLVHIFLYYFINLFRSISCSEIFQNVLECSMFLVLSTPLLLA